MADRLRFRFARQGHIIKYGTVALDVLNPYDPEEIIEKLTKKEFSEYLEDGEEFETEEDWKFVPILDDDPEVNIYEIEPADDQDN